MYVYTHTHGLCVYMHVLGKKKKKERNTEKGKDRQRLSEKWSPDCLRVPIPPGAEQAWQEVGAASHSQQHPQPQSMLGILWEAYVANSEISGRITGGAEVGDGFRDVWKEKLRIQQGATEIHLLMKS